MDNTTDTEGHCGHDLIYSPEAEIWPLPAMCASQVLLDDISCKWAILTIATLSRGRSAQAHAAGYQSEDIDTGLAPLGTQRNDLTDRVGYRADLG
jgi:hypothetical protein